MQVGDDTIIEEAPQASRSPTLPRAPVPSTSRPITLETGIIPTQPATQFNCECPRSQHSHLQYSFYSTRPIPSHPARDDHCRSPPLFKEAPLRYDLIIHANINKVIYVAATKAPASKASASTAASKRPVTIGCTSIFIHIHLILCDLSLIPDSSSRTPLQKTEIRPKFGRRGNCRGRGRRHCCVIECGGSVPGSVSPKFYSSFLFLPPFHLAVNISVDVEISQCTICCQHRR
jgi:hypothetical protein